MKYEIIKEDRERFYREGRHIIKLIDKNNKKEIECLLRVEKRNLIEIEKNKKRYNICEYRHSIIIRVGGITRISRLPKQCEIEINKEKVLLKINKASLNEVEYTNNWKYKAERVFTGIGKEYMRGRIWK